MILLFWLTMTQSTRWIRRRLGRKLAVLQHYAFWRETRTRILLSTIGLLGLSVGLAVPMVYKMLFDQVDRRVQQVVREEIDQFQSLVLQHAPQEPEQVKEILLEFLSSELVEDDLFLIAIYEGEFLLSSPNALPSLFRAGSLQMAAWQQIQSPVQREVLVADPDIVSMIYWAEPIRVQETVVGVLVVAQTTAGEREEATASLQVVVRVLLIVFCFTLLLAWFTSGYLLRPLREIAATARAVNESDLSHRIPVKGNDELAEIGTAFNDMMDRLQDAFINQKNFINDASHELRTPITIVQGHLDLIGEVTEEQREVLDLVHDELDRMNRFVHDLLTLAQAEQPDFWQPNWVELESLTEELWDKAKVLIHCSLELDEKAAGQLRLDRQRVTQAVMNLVENACQHTPAEGSISLGSALSYDHVCFWVRDTGSGIPLQEQQRIFERFARSTYIRRRSRGAGLGLSIVQAIALSAGGRIELFSRPGVGSTFTLILPILT
jgi:signal transduction histidine kinase